MNPEPSQPASTPSPSPTASPRTSNLKGRWKRASGPGVPAPRPAAASPASFGEVADVTSARESLSGQHVRGYESAKPAAPASPPPTIPPKPTPVAARPVAPAAPAPTPAPKPLPAATPTAPTAASGLATPYPDTDLPPVPTMHPASSRPEPRLQSDTPRMVSSLPTPKIWKATPQPESQSTAVAESASPPPPRARAPLPREFPRDTRRDPGRDSPPPRTAAAASRPFEVPRDPRLEPLTPRVPADAPRSRKTSDSSRSEPSDFSADRRRDPRDRDERFHPDSRQDSRSDNRLEPRREHSAPARPGNDGRSRGDRENYVALKPDPANDPAPRRLRTEVSKPVPVEEYTPSAFSAKVPDKTIPVKRSHESTRREPEAKVDSRERVRPHTTISAHVSDSEEETVAPKKKSRGLVGFIKRFLGVQGESSNEKSAAVRGGGSRSRSERHSEHSREDDEADRSDRHRPRSSAESHSRHSHGEHRSSHSAPARDDRPAPSRGDRHDRNNDHRRGDRR